MCHAHKRGNDNTIYSVATDGWIDMDGHGWTWMDMDGHGWTWMDMDKA